MTVLIALAVSFGVLAIVATWLYLGPLAAFDMQSAAFGWLSQTVGGKRTKARRTGLTHWLETA